MFNLIYVVLSMIYRKAVNSLLVAKRLQIFSKIFLTKITLVSQLFLNFECVCVRTHANTHHTLRSRVCHIIDE